MTIKNTPKNDDRHILNIRWAIEHRATWLYFLLMEARKKGLEWDDFARSAIFQTGCFYGDFFADKTADLESFARQFPGDLGKQLFEMEVAESTPSRYVLEFHYCPLVSAWMRLTDNEADIAHLCDIAMDGDRGIASRFPDLHLDITHKIAEGDDVCRLVYTLQKRTT